MAARGTSGRCCSVILHPVSGPMAPSSRSGSVAGCAGGHDPVVRAARKNQRRAWRSGSSRFPACLSRSAINSFATVIEAPALLALQKRRNPNTACLVRSLAASSKDVESSVDCQSENETGTGHWLRAAEKFPASPVRLSTEVTSPAESLTRQVHSSNLLSSKLHCQALARNHFSLSMLNRD